MTEATVRASERLESAGHGSGAGGSTDGTRKERPAATNVDSKRPDEGPAESTEELPPRADDDRQKVETHIKTIISITCKSVSWSCEIWKCQNLPEGLLSEEKWRRVLCTTILFNFSPEYVQDGLRKASCKVKQSSRLPGCDFDISAR